MTVATTASAARHGRRRTSRIESWLGRFDAVTVASAYAFLLLLVPARIVFAPIGGSGTPANLLALLAGLWYLAARVVSSPPFAVGRQPVRIALLLIALSILASYVYAMMRSISAAEVMAADRGVIGLLAWCTVALVIADGAVSRERLDVLLHRVVLLGAVIALFGIVTFLTGLDLTHYIVIPGFSSNGDLDLGLLQRGGLNRPASTASHPIEFGVIMATLLPLAVREALRDDQRPALRRWGPVGLIALAGLMSVSRSAVLGYLVVATILLASWPRARRKKALLAMLGFAVLTRVMVPGLLGTIRNLFTGIASDTSTTARTADYSGTLTFISQRPLFGRGFDTFLPLIYRYTDNQYLKSLVEVGVVGVACLLAMFFIALGSVRSARRGTSGDAAELGTAITASLSVLLLTYGTFDALGFPMSAGLTFLLLGVAGAYWRLYHAGSTADPRPDRLEVVAA